MRFDVVVLVGLELLLQIWSGAVTFDVLLVVPGLLAWLVGHLSSFRNLADVQLDAVSVLNLP
jgi:hypothetical protein